MTPNTPKNKRPRQGVDERPCGLQANRASPSWAGAKGSERIIARPCKHANSQGHVQSRGELMHAGRKCTPGPVACPVGDRGFWGCRRLGLCCPASGRPSREVARAAGPGEAPEREMAAGRGRGYGRNQREQQPIPARGPTRNPPLRACALRGARSRAPAPRAGDTKGWRESAERG